jgi:hypothetical protein
MNREVAKQLGEGKIPKGNKIGWARRRLLNGCIVARYGWSLDAQPRRMHMRLEGKGEVQILTERLENGDDIPCTRLSWADIEADDWYVMIQLKMAR